MYLFFANPQFLLEVSYVARRDRPGERYYQRLIKKKRLDAIASYVNAGNLLPNNIIIAFGGGVQRAVDFHENTPIHADLRHQLESLNIRHGTLEFPRDYRSCWVVDGQHRLYAFMKVTKPSVVPVLAFKDLDIERQCSIFLDINKYQKRVPADLVWDLNGEMIPSQQDGVISNVVKLLNEETPLRHKFYIPSKGFKKHQDQIKMAGMCLSIKRVRLASANTVSKIQNPFYVSDPKELVKKLGQGLSEYLTVVSTVLRNDWALGKDGFVLTDGGLSVMVRFFEKIVARVKETGIPTTLDYQKYLRPLVDFLEKEYSSEDARRKLRRGSSSEGGKDELVRDFVLYVKKSLNDPLFGGEISHPGIKEIMHLEKRLQDLICDIYATDEREDRLAGRIPEDTFKMLEKQAASRGISPKHYYQLLTLGQCVNVMRSDRGSFFPSFINNDATGFATEKDFETALDHVLRMRRPETHSTLHQKRLGDDELLTVYLRRLNGCLDNCLPSDPDLDDEEDDADSDDSEQL